MRLFRRSRRNSETPQSNKNNESPRRRRQQANSPPAADNAGRESTSPQRFRSFRRHHNESPKEGHHVKFSKSTESRDEKKHVKLVAPEKPAAAPRPTKQRLEKTSPATVGTYTDGTTEESATHNVVSTSDSSVLDVPPLRSQQPASSVIAEEIPIDGTFRYFKKGRFLGQGGFSKVYECVQQDTDEHFAIKVVPKEKRTLEMLHMEVDIQRSLKHPNVCGCMRLFQDPHNTYVLLEVCDNRSLDRVLQRRKRLPEDQASFLFRQLVDAVAFMQNKHVLHRDLKAANLFLDAKMDVKVGDFGLARQLTSPNEYRTTRCGTPNYMAPEIIQGDRYTRQYSLPVDVWSLGIILYLLLAGKLPFDGELHERNPEDEFRLGERQRDHDETYRRILANEYNFPMRLFHDISKEAQGLIARILKTDARMRPSASSLLRHPFFTSGGFVPSPVPPMS